MISGDGFLKTAFVVFTLMSVSLLTEEAVAVPLSEAQIYVYGYMGEGACLPQMDSLWQQIDLGEIPTSSLQKTGDQGPLIPVVFHFKYCIRMSGASESRNRVGTRTVRTIQPALTATFIAPADNTSPKLIGVTGVSGVALRVTDAQHNDIPPGQRSVPQFLTPGSNVVVYYVNLERTSAPLTVGHFQAVANLFLEYD